MRDIKFKFWDSINHYWCDERDYFVNSDGVSMYFGSVEDDPVPEKWVIPVLFTGLKDKNGVELYAGDVVRIAGYGNYVCEFPFIELYDSSGEGDIGALIGNIYENPSLNE